MSHLLTFDLEHWYEGYRYRNIKGWESHPHRDSLVIDWLLILLNDCQVKATFFTTGRFAQEFPQLIEKVVENKHELASHSYSHTRVVDFPSLSKFNEDLGRSLTILRRISGSDDSVTGFRAPKWSLPSIDRNAYYQILIDNGLLYDSSLYPLNRSDTRYPHKIEINESATIWQIPAATFSIVGINIPAAGGLWLRLFPAAISRLSLKQAEAAKMPTTIYLHPYDFDCPRIPVGWKLSQVLFYLARCYRLKQTSGTLTDLLQQFKFQSIKNWLDDNRCFTSDSGKMIEL